jgi:hypothetical protein
MKTTTYSRSDSLGTSSIHPDRILLKAFGALAITRIRVDFANSRRLRMEFWQGVIIGIFAGANIGVLIGCLFAGCRREACPTGDVGGWQHMDEAVMEEAVPPVSRTPRPVIAAAPQPFENS